MIKSPLNYTGNKYRTLEQMLPHFPQKIHNMVDLFCGGATVGLNTLCDHVTFVDSCPRVIGLLKFLASQNTDNLLEDLVRLIDTYHLSYSARDGYDFYKSQVNDNNYNNGLKQYNSDGFYALRRDYNNIQDKQISEANLMLYILLVYGFNNDLRFSKTGDYNLPVGKTDLNRQNISKLRAYIERIHEIDSEFVCDDFRSPNVRHLLNDADFVYLDPPYLISDAVYNESSKWCVSTETDLLALLSDFITNGKKFVLSNILYKTNARNELLVHWLEENKNYVCVVDIDYHYRGASYNKKNRNAKEREVIIKSSY